MVSLPNINKRNASHKPVDTGFFNVYILYRKELFLKINITDILIISYIYITDEEKPITQET